jgi:very-short-patch-repair endonuclease
MRRFTDKQLARARDQRRAMTHAETIMWQCLRDRRSGEKFRRQVPIGPYVGDFVCVRARIIIELDGPPHEKADQQVRDRRRDKWLASKGWRVLRFSNELVIGGTDILMNQINAAIAGAKSPSSASTASALAPPVNSGEERSRHLLPQAGEGTRSKVPAPAQSGEGDSSAGTRSCTARSGDGEAN